MSRTGTFQSKPRQCEAIQYDGSVESAKECGLSENPITHRRYLDLGGERHWVDKGMWVLTDKVGYRKVVSDELLWDVYESVDP